MNMDMGVLLGGWRDGARRGRGRGMVAMQEPLLVGCDAEIPDTSTLICPLSNPGRLWRNSRMFRANWNDDLS
jgi:hypothetical protein